MVLVDVSSAFHSIYNNTALLERICVACKKKPNKHNGIEIVRKREGEDIIYRSAHAASMVEKKVL